MIFLATSLTVVLTSIVVFLIVIIFLVIMLLYARKKLIPQGEVKLKVNDREYMVSPGSTVLSVLGSNEIYLPSACG